MEKIVIYGCGSIGQLAYELLKEQYKILFFVDRCVGGGDNRGLNF